MSWTTPRTWATDELVTASMMNTHVRDNLNHLFGERQWAFASTMSQVSTTSTSYVDVTGLTLNLTPTGSRVQTMAFVFGRSVQAGWPGLFRLMRTGGTASGLFAAIYNISPLMLRDVWTGLTPGTQYTFAVQFAGQNGYQVQVNYSTGALFSWLLAWEY